MRASYGTIHTKEVCIRAPVLRATPLFCLMLATVWMGSATAETLHRGNGPEPDSLDPHLAQGVAAGNLLRDLYEGLVTEAADGSLTGGLAQAWTVSDDGLVWHFKLRPGLRWSDASELDGDDIVLSLRRAVAPSTAAPYANLLNVIAGAEAILRGEAEPDTLAVSSEAGSLRIALHRPEPSLPTLLSLPIAFPVHSSVRSGQMSAGSPRLVSNGAYRLQQRVLHSHLELTANPHYHVAESVAIATVVYHITEDPHSELARFRSGELHITETLPPGRIDPIRQQYPKQLRVTPYLGTFWLGYNLARAPFADQPALREALSLAIDRSILVRHITAAGELEAWSVVPPGLQGYQPAHPEYADWSQSQREQRARELLADAGIDGHDLRIEVRYNSSSGQRRLALAVAAMWREVLGVTARLHNEEWKVFVINRRHGRLTQVFRGGWIADYPDPRSFLDLFRSDSALNASAFRDSGYDQLLNKALHAEPLQSAILLRQAESLLLEQHPVIPLYHYVSRHLVSTRVCGWVDNLLDRHPSRLLWLDDSGQCTPD